LGLETHVQHAISLVKNKVLDVDEGDTATLDQVDQTTGSGNEKIAAALDLAQLGANIGTTVHDTRADPRTVGELAGLIEDLRDQLTGRSKDEGCGVGLALAAVAELARSLSRDGGGTVLEGLGKDREQETTSLSGTGLGTGHQITAVHDNGHRVLLHRGRGDIASQLDVRDKVVVKRGVGEGVDGLRHIVTRGLDGDIVVIGEVDSSLLLGGVVGNTEKLALNTGIGRAGDVLAIAPLTISRTTGSAAAAAAAAVVTTTTAVALS
jgi:hypothetical protein